MVLYGLNGLYNTWKNGGSPYPLFHIFNVSFPSGQHYVMYCQNVDSRMPVVKAAAALLLVFSCFVVNIHSSIGYQP